MRDFTVAFVPTGEKAGVFITPCGVLILPDLAFVFFALTHGLYGLWIVTGDYIKWDWARMVIFFGLLLLAVVLFGFAAITLIPFTH